MLETKRNGRPILLTGGCGFIGTSLVARLLELRPGAGIRVVDNLSVGSLADLAEVCEFSEADAAGCRDRDGVVFVRADIRDKDAMLACAEGAGAVVHLAAQTGVGPSVESPRFDLEQNILGTFNVLEAARAHGIGRFVFASSSAPAGIVEPPVREDMPVRPISPYGASKLAGEAYCSVYAHTFGVGTVALRFGNVYGPRSTNKASVVAKFIKHILAGEPCEIYGDGTQTRDFLFIDDLLGAVLAALDSDVAGEVFQIASSSERTVGEVAELIADAFRRLDGRLAEIVHGPKRAGDVQRNYSDTSKAMRMLRWQTRMELGDGIDRTVRFFLDREHGQ